jgi:hypothetical protein
MSSFGAKQLSDTLSLGFVLFIFGLALPGSLLEQYTHLVYSYH